MSRVLLKGFFASAGSDGSRQERPLLVFGPLQVWAIPEKARGVTPLERAAGQRFCRYQQLPDTSVQRRNWGETAGVEGCCVAASGRTSGMKCP